MKTTIPAKTIIECDRCSKEICHINKNNLLGGFLNYGSQNSLDWQGVPIAKGSEYEFDLCDNCYRDLYDCLDEWRNGTRC